MKRRASAIVIIIIVATLIATLLIHNQISNLQSQISELQAQNDELQEQNDELQEQNTEMQYQINDLQEHQTESPLRITDVLYAGGFTPYIGLTIESTVYVTILNNHTYPVGGLTLINNLFERTGEESGGPYTLPIDELQAGESREIKTYAFWQLGSSHSILVVTLKSGDVILDEWVERNLDLP
jgi:hypothetical protein